MTNHSVAPAAEESKQDPKCGTCAYRVNELRRTPEPYQAGSTMVCLHPKVGRKDCRQARLGPNAECGPDAVLWRAHARTAPLQTELEIG